MIQLERYFRSYIGGGLLLTLLFFLSPGAFSQTAATFDIDRYSTFGEGFFETFYVDETHGLQSALDSGLVTETTQLLVTRTDSGNLAMIRDQMAFHHIAQGEANGLAWMATF